MQQAQKLKSFDAIISRLENLFTEPDQVEILNTYKTPKGEYPLIKIVLGKGNPRRALISAGIHGDEPGGVESICSFLEQNCFTPYKNEWEVTLLPCINPYGYEFGVRENYEGKDLNRLFKVDEPPLEVSFAQSFLNTSFDLTIELHEDNESSGYYLYQKGLDDKEDALGFEILRSVESIMPINLNNEIDGSKAHKGIIEKDIDISNMDWWPMAFYGLSKGARKVLTLETATQFDLETRIQAHLTAIQTALKHFSGDTI